MPEDLTPRGGDVKKTVDVEAADRSGKPALPTETHKHTALPSPTGVPKRIGQYRIKRAIASGGMGTVYEALQEKPKRSVALKVMKHGITSRSAQRRFEYESQLLARLHHPGIAQVYEAGTHKKDGATVPYFAMEYIADAKSLTQYAKEKRLGTRERLTLFSEVCEAVHHGHQRGVIHRDLKPSNILVDPSGQVKVIDFGVARSTDSDLVVTTMKTDIGQLIGTLQYMSPEQCAADPDDIDTRSDVYSLGVVLYELLCQRMPYDIKGAAIHEAVRVIREEDPTQLSAHDRTLRGDVETIARKALEKERTRRYQSASALTADIDRYLNNQPIAARPASAMYQLRKFARRNRALVGGAVSTLVVLIAGIIGTTAYARSERAQRRRADELALMEMQQRELAEAARDEAEAVTTFLTDTLGAADPEKDGKEVTVREVIDKAAEAIGERFADRPLIEARIRQAIGWTYRGLGLYASALEHLAESAAIYTRELGPDDDRVFDAVSSHAVVVGDLGDYSSAEASSRSTLAIQQRVLGRGHRRTLLTMSNLAGSVLQQGRYDEAEVLFRDLYELMREALGMEHPDTLSSARNLATCFLEQGRYAEAVALFTTVLEATRRAFGNEHPKTLTTLHNIAVTLQAQARYAEAEAFLRETLEIRQRKLGEEHPSTLQARTNLANSLYYQGRYDDAESLYRGTREIRTRILGEEHPETLISMNNIALCLHKQGKYEEMETLVEATLEARRRVLGDEHPHSLDSMRHLATCYRGQERYAEAEALTRRALETQRRVLGEDHPLTLASMGNLAGNLNLLGRHEEAEAMARDALTIIKRVLGDRHPNMLKMKTVLASSWEGQGRLAEAEELTRNILDMRRSILGNEHPDTVQSLVDLAAILTTQERHADAEKFVVERVETLRRVHGPADRRTLEALEDMVIFYERCEAVEPGKGYDAKAAEWRAKLAKKDVGDSED